MLKGFRLRRPEAARILATCLALGLLASPLTAQTPLGTSFIYQGRLSQAGAPASGPFDLEFRLFGVDTGGSDVAAPVVIEDVPVTSGLFAVTLDFGAAAFAGQKRWLEVGVRPGASTGAFTPLAGRQELTPAPNAVFSATAGDAATLGGIPSSGYRLTGGVLSVAEGGTGATTAAGARTNLQAAQSGANSDITAISGLTTALSVQQGGTGATSPEAGRLALGAQGLLIGTGIRTLANSNSDMSLRIGADGLGLIIHGTVSGGRAFHCSNPTCTTGTSSAITGNPGDVSLAIGADGLGLYASRDGGLRVGHCADAVCTSATTTLIHSGNNKGADSAMAIGADGLGLISYKDLDTDDLMVAHCSDAACTSATVSTLDSAGNVGRFTSLAIGDDGLGLISYHDMTNGTLKVAHCSNTACTSATLATLGPAAANRTSLAVGPDGLGLISYQTPAFDLAVARCSDTACTAATFATLDSFLTVGGGSSLAIDANGRAVISYNDSSNTSLKLAHCLDTACTTASLQTLDSVGDVGGKSSLAAISGGVLVAYFDFTNGALKVAQIGETLALEVGGTGASSAAGSRANLGAAASGANSDITSLNALTIDLSVTQGGTGASDATAARANLVAAKSGANSDITSLTGLTTDLSVTLGGTGASDATTARTNLGAAARGANSDITSLSGLTTDLSVAQGGTGASDATTARANLDAAKRGVNSDITALTALTTPLTVAQGGTGATSAAAALAALGGQPVATPATSLATIDPSGGLYSSATIGADGLGLIVSTTAATGGQLQVAHCSDVSCSSATLTTLIGILAGGAGYPSLTVATNGFGLISAYAEQFKNLTVVRCLNAGCSSYSASGIEVVADAGSHSSIAIGADGLPLISYYDESATALRVAHCSDPTCEFSPYTLTTLDGSAIVGGTSLTIGADGFGLISYYDTNGDDLKVVHCTNATCSTFDPPTTIDATGDVGRYNSITIGADGLGLISYDDETNEALKTAHCTNTACSTFGTPATIDDTATGNFGEFTSITIGADGLGLISYRNNGDNTLKVAHCANTACTSASKTTLDSSGDVGSYTSVTIGSDGLGLISYHDVTNAALKVAHCQNLLCSPFVVRRR